MSDFATHEQRIEITSPDEFGKVAVLLGGSSSEREVSLQTGTAVLAALQSLGVDAHAFDPAELDMAVFMSRGFNRAWIALHGANGEDGTIQGALQWLGVPYTGSGVLASALAMDKVRSKHLFAAADIATPEYCVLHSRHDAAIALEQLGLPLIMKPASQGSSVGMSKVFSRDELNAAYDLASDFGDDVIAERCIVGDEVTVAILQGEALPSIRIETPRVFYDYRAKYESDTTLYHVPATLDVALEQRYADLALAAFRELGCSGWGRVDFMTGADGQPQVLEVNTVPGMTSHSLVPMAAKACDISFPALCWRILETSFQTEHVYAMQGGAQQ